MIMTCSSGLLKIWNARSGAPLRTVGVGFAICCAFISGDRHAVVGTKDGKIQLVELHSGDALEEHDAHDGAVWSIDVRPDGKGMCSCSNDKTVKFWDFGVLRPGNKDKDQDSDSGSSDHDDDDSSDDEASGAP